MSTIKVTVPATTANLGPGFDCIGLALSLYNQFLFSPLTQNGKTLQISAAGPEADRVSLDADNLVYQAFGKLYTDIGQSVPPVSIDIHLGIPQARGLGSSATAIVGGLVGANQMAGQPLSQEQLLKLAIAIEGHPDNVVPAFLGGCRLAASAQDDWTICEIPWHPDIVPVVAIPDFELSTAAARQVLPAEYSRADAIFNTAHLGLLVRALETGNRDWLKVAMQDRIHQPYRQSLIKGYAEVRQAAIEAGAYEMVISGAGPTLLALTNQTDALAVAEAMGKTWQTHDVKAIVQVLPVDSQGVQVA
ncbi:MAG: homoserine kinase [Microcoleaceae cyanobacterium]